MRFNTSLVHGGVKRTDKNGSTHVPIYQVSAFGHESAEELEKIFGNRAAGFTYTRLGNPTVEAFTVATAYLAPVFLLRMHI